MAVFSIGVVKSKKTKNYLALDFGTSSLKYLSISNHYHRLKVNYVGMLRTPGGAFSNGALSAPHLLSQQIEDLLKEKKIVEKEVVFSLPSTNVFIKKIIVSCSNIKDLISKIPYEAANYIPQNIKDVYLDFQVLGPRGKNNFEVLLAAAKKDVVANYLEAISNAGLDPIIADVDIFSLENAFEYNCSDYKDSSVALLNLGESYSNITILQDGQLLTNGDIPRGAKLYRDALSMEFGLSSDEIDQIFLGKTPIDQKFLDCINNITANFSDELCNKVSYLWAAAGTDKKILGLFLSGGLATLPGMLPVLQEKTGINCQIFDVFRGIDTSYSKNFNEQEQHLYAVCLGLALRKLGDKKHVLV